MRQYLLVGALAALLFLAACAGPQNTPETAPPAAELAPGPPAFSLAFLPELPPFTPPAEIINRYGGKAFADTLIPADDYGRLYPYAGKIIGNNWWLSRSYYGLVDSEGRVVVDPVYRSAYYANGAGGQPAYLVLSYPVAEDDMAAQELLNASGGFAQRSRHQFASPDGSWVSDFYYGDEARISQGRVIISNYEGQADDFWYNVTTHYQLYDLAGRLIATGEGYLNDFSEGLGLVQHTVFDEQTHTQFTYYDYIDTEGRLAIAGPFLEARGFENGRAAVTMGEDWANRSCAVIDTNGNFVEGPSTENVDMFYSYQEPYNHFYSESGVLCGLTDRAGNIIVPAEYMWISLPYQEEPNLPNLAVAAKGDASYWIISLPGGQCRQVELPYIVDASVCGNDWCQFTYGGGMALIKGEMEHHFPAEQGSAPWARHIEGELFAINYFATDEQGQEYARTDIFDAVQGQVIKTFPGHEYNYCLNGALLIFYKRSTNSFVVTRRDFEPAFGPDTLGGEALTNINHVADDVYEVRTAFCSGLLRENGEWLVRVRANSID